MDLLTFGLGVFCLLVLPGPTNAVLALATSALTPGRCLTLVGAVVVAYQIMVLLVSGFASPIFHSHPEIAQAVKFLAATWVLALALKLWAPSQGGKAATVGPRELFVTTLLNPKAIIIGLAMVPSVGADAVPTMLVLLATTAATSALWLAFGRAIIGRRQEMPLFARRCGSAVLLVFCVMLTLSGLT